MSVLVWIEQNQDGAVASSWELAGKGRELADALGGSLNAVVMGASTDDVAAQAQTYGFDNVYTITDPVSGELPLDGLCSRPEEGGGGQRRYRRVGQRHQPRPRGDCSGCLPARCGLAPDVIDLNVEDGKLVALRSVYSNNILTDVTFATPVQVASARPRSFAMPEAGAAGGTVYRVGLGSERR